MMFAAIKCPICAGECREKRDKNTMFVIETKCTMCKQYRYQYFHDQKKHVETVAGVIYVLSASLSDEEYDQMEDDVNNAQLAAQKAYWKNYKEEAK